MKKLCVAILFLSSFLAGKSQFVVNGGDTISITGTTSPASPIVGTGHCHNTGNDSISLTWNVISDSTVPGWTYTGFCDNNNCYNFYIGARRTFTLAPGASGILELHLTQACVSGEGNVKFLLWNSADSAGSVQLVTFAVNITPGTGCASGIAANEAEQFLLSPNPVKDQLTIRLPSNTVNGQIDIYNLLGSKLASQPFSNNETIKYFDLSEFAAGFYVAAISEGGKLIAARKFTRQD
jgi:hypothetical protein